ncbi:hypothetical protein B0H14DRAFT_3062006, partial [Mycena olivaceomarginata]
METPPRAHIDSRAVEPCLRAELVCGARLYSSTKAFCSRCHFKRCWIYVIVCQDLLFDRLPASLALHARHLRAPFPMRDVDGDCAPDLRAVGPSSGERRVDPLTFLSLSTPAPRAPLPFSTITRARSSSCESAGSSGAALEMPALMATLLLRRREGKQTGAEADILSTRQLGIGDIVASLRCRAQLDD